MLRANIDVGAGHYNGGLYKVRKRGGRERTPFTKRDVIRIKILLDVLVNKVRSVVLPEDIETCEVTLFGPLGHKRSEELVLGAHSFAQHEWIDGTLMSQGGGRSRATCDLLLLSDCRLLSTCKGRLKRISTLRAIPIQLAHAQTIAISQVVTPYSFRPCALPGLGCITGVGCIALTV